MTDYKAAGRLASSRAQGAAVHPKERTAVVADVHLGYEWGRKATQGGDCVPAHSLDETIARLSALLPHRSLDRLDRGG